MKLNLSQEKCILFFVPQEPSPIKNSRDQESVPLAISLLNAVCDLLFCPEFTVAPNKTGNGRDEAEDLQNIDSCEYIWAGGVGFSQIVSNIQTAASYDLHRRELLNCEYIYNYCNLKIYL